MFGLMRLPINDHRYTKTQICIIQEVVYLFTFLVLVIFLYISLIESTLLTVFKDKSSAGNNTSKETWQMFSSFCY